MCSDVLRRGKVVPHHVLSSRLHAREQFGIQYDIGARRAEDTSMGSVHVHKKMCWLVKLASWRCFEDAWLPADANETDVKHTPASATPCLPCTDAVPCHATHGTPCLRDATAIALTSHPPHRPSFVAPFVLLGTQEQGHLAHFAHSLDSTDLGLHSHDSDSQTP